MSTRDPLVRLLDDEVVVDNFAGGGGASTGIAWAIGRSPDIAINHDREALAVHAANHPTTEHIQEDVFTVDPVKVLAGRKCGLVWFSPDCTFFSKAKGGKPFRDRSKARRVRGLIGVALKWFANPASRPRVAIIENVEEIEDWCRIGADGRPDYRFRGEHWRRWVNRVRAYGGRLEWRRQRGCDFGAPTTRRRLFIIIRFDGQPIRWPEPTHGPARGRTPFRVAAECIDFSLPIPSIFLTQAEAKAWATANGVEAPRRPLALATQRRIARGVMKFVVNAAEPFIVPVVHGGDERVHSVREPMRTIVASDREFALVVPTLINTRNGERLGQHPRILDISQPFGTVTAQGSQGALVAAFLAKHNGGHEATGQRVDRPVAAVTTRDQKALVTANLVKLYGTCRDGQAVTDPMAVVTAHGNHLALVHAFLVKFYGTAVARPLGLPLDTVTTKDRFGLVVVTVGGEDYVIVDIGMRMLTPRELYLAQGFPADYVIDVLVPKAIGRKHPRVVMRPLTKKAQTRMCGNSVNPDVAAALAAANLAPREQWPLWRGEATA